MFTTTATARARALVVMLAVVGIVVLQSVLCGATVSRPGCCPVSGAHATSGSSAGGAGAAGVDAHGDEHSDLEAATAAGPVGVVVSVAPSSALVDPGRSGAVLGACLLIVIAVLAALAGLIGRDPYRTSWRRATEPRPGGGVPPIPAVRLDQLCVLRT